MQVARVATFTLLVAGCREPPSEPVELGEAPRWVAAPGEHDVGASCIDVDERRVCFGERPGAVHGVSIVERPLPEGRSSVRGWRCSGTGEARRCEDRAFGSDAFGCNDKACTQQHPRLPDDGEWECAEIDGAVICRGGEAAAGVVAGAADPAWICGARRAFAPRRGFGSVAGERVCVDFSPDRPSAEQMRECRFLYEPNRARRLCSAGNPTLGRACDGEAGCPAGLVCAAGHCLPLEPSPSCWLDRDCGTGVCLHGSCRGDG